MRDILLGLLDKIEGRAPGKAVLINSADADALGLLLQSPLVQELMGDIELPAVEEIVEPSEEVAPPKPEPMAPTQTQTDEPPIDMRAAIDKLSKKEFANVSSAEIALLESTLESTVNNPNQNASTERLAGLISGLLKEHAHYSETEIAELIDDTPLENHAIISEEFFTSKKRARVRSISGIETDQLLSTYELDGTVEIEGDVPAESLLIVRRGGVTVNGYVFGNIVAAGPISIRKNVQGGMVITSNGNIELENILTGSSIIAEEGAIICQTVEMPYIVYATKGVTIEKRVRGGRIVGTTVTVRGNVSAAEVHAVGTIEAEAFDSTPGSETVVCLRRELSCADFGRPLGDSYGKLKRTLATDNYRREHLENFIRHTEADVSDSHKSMLYFLLGGVDNRRTLCLLRGSQCQTIYMGQLIDAAAGFAEFMATQVEVNRESAVVEIEPVAGECLKVLQGLSEAIDAIPQEFGLGIKKGLAQKNHQITNVVRKAATLAESKNATHYIDILGRYLEQWEKELEDAKDKSQLFVKKVGIGVELSRRIEQQSDRLSLMIDTLVKDGGEKLSFEQRARITSGFMRLMQSVVSQHHVNIAKWRKELATLRDKVQTTQLELQEEALAIPGDVRAYGTCQAICDHFDKDVVITTLPGYSSDMLTDGKQVVRISKRIDEPTIFRLSGSTILRETPRRK